MSEAPTLAEANIHFIEPSPPPLPPLSEDLPPPSLLFLPGETYQQVILLNPKSENEELFLELGTSFIDSVRLSNLDEDLEEIDTELLSDEYCKSFRGECDLEKEFFNSLKSQQEQVVFHPSPWPVQGWISSPFGYRISPFTNRRAFHKGIDIAGRAGSSIYAVNRGIVIFSGCKGQYGNAIIIQHGFGFSTLYGHNSINVVKSGDKVERGQLIGYLGNTGRSTAPHLHYEIRKDGRCINPRNYLFAKLF